jgi:hypothetical protein
MKLISSIEEFKVAKAAFVNKHGDSLMMASEAKRAVMLEELAPLAKFSKMPAERLLTAMAKQYAEGHL